MAVESCTAITVREIHAYNLCGPLNGRYAHPTPRQGADVATGNSPPLRACFDRQPECKGHGIKEKKILENQSNIKDFNSKPLTPSEMMKSQTSPNCLVNHSDRPKEENINKG